MDSEILQTFWRGALRSLHWLVGPVVAIGFAIWGAIEWETANLVAWVCLVAFVREAGLYAVQIAQDEYIAELQRLNAEAINWRQCVRESEAVS